MLRFADNNTPQAKAKLSEELIKAQDQLQKEAQDAVSGITSFVHEEQQKLPAQIEARVKALAKLTGLPSVPSRESGECFILLVASPYSLERVPCT